MNKLKLKTNDTITVLYKIVNIDQNKDTIFNMAFLSKNKDNISIDQICPFGSNLSKNGEYRNGVINWQNFNYFLENNNTKILFETLIMYITNTLRERKIKLSIQYFYPNTTNNKIKKKCEEVCETNSIRFYTIAWTRFYYQYISGILPNNLNDAFIEVMLKYKKKDKSEFIKILSQFKKESEIFIYICNNSIDKKINLNKNHIFGQKFMVLTLATSNHLYNIEYNVWRELSINSQLTKLVSDKVTNGFPILNNYIMIYANNIAELFDNPIVEKKIYSSNIATRVVELLTQAYQYTPKLNKKINKNIEITIKNVLTKIARKNIATTELDNFNTLKDSINHSINYAKEHVILSHTVINMISEYTGQVFYDSALVTADMFSSTKYNTFKKYMFQLLYNIYCLNTKVHCIHADLHLNNITINPEFNKNDIKSHILYKLDVGHEYVFENNYKNLCIIDFGNSIINPNHYAINKDIPISKDNLLQSQIDWLLHNLYKVKPEYKHFNIINNNIVYHYDEYFKILSALDIFNISSKILLYLNTTKHLGEISDQSVHLVTAINNSANYYLTTVFEKLLNTKDYTEFQNMDWPAISIIKEIFAKDIYNKNIINISNTYTYYV